MAKMSETFSVRNLVRHLPDLPECAIFSIALPDFDLSHMASGALENDPARSPREKSAKPPPGRQVCHLISSIRCSAREPPHHDPPRSSDHDTPWSEAD
jgi:hypothetical protein